MKKPRLSSTKIDTQLPANHPLPLLDKAAVELLDGEVERLWTLDNSVSGADLLKYLRAALLQSYYSIPDYDVFSDHVRFNSLFRSFIGFADPGEEWDGDQYRAIHYRWTVDQELRRFLLELIESVSQLPIQVDDTIAMENCNRIEERLSAWVDQYCPKAVYFQQFTNPPIRRFFASVSFSGAAPNEDVRALLTDDVSKVLKSAFPNQVEQEEEGFGVEELLFLSPSEEQSLLLSFAKVSLSCNPGHFESWEDSVKPYLMPMIALCKASRSYASAEGAMLQFGNVINLPAEVDLSDYFNMLPKQPPKVVPPRLMREHNLSYSFPTKMLRSAYTTELQFDSAEQLLLCSYEINSTADGLRIELDLESQWSEPFVINSLDQVFDDLRNNLYVAFHSLITDRTRALFE